jgi:hypothetical protein
VRVVFVGRLGRQSIARPTLCHVAYALSFSTRVMAAPNDVILRMTGEATLDAKPPLP